MRDLYQGTHSVKTAGVCWYGHEISGSHYRTAQKVMVPLCYAKTIVPLVSKEAEFCKGSIVDADVGSLQ